MNDAGLLDKNQKSRIRAALLRCESLKLQRVRDTIQVRLEAIGDAIPRALTALDDIYAIADTCAQYPDGLRLLAEIVEEVETVRASASTFAFVVATVQGRVMLSVDRWSELREIAETVEIAPDSLRHAWARSARTLPGSYPPKSLSEAILKLVHLTEHSLFEFLARLALDSPDGARIDDWLNDVFLDRGDLAPLGDLRGRIVAGDRTIPVYLLVEMRPRPGADARLEPGEALYVSRGIISREGEAPNPIYPRVGSIPAETERRPVRETLLTLIDDLYAERGQPHIELFAPRAYLGHAYDEWIVSLGVREPVQVVLGADMPVVMRWIERIDDTIMRERCSNIWHASRAAHGGAAPRAPLHAITADEEATTMAQLRESLDPLLLLCCDPDGSPEGANALRVALTAGTPIVLWLRGSAGCGQSEAALAAIATSPRGDIPSAVYTARRSAIAAKKPPDDPARRITIIYDDPRRLPPRLRLGAPRPRAGAPVGQSRG